MYIVIIRDYPVVFIVKCQGSIVRIFLAIGSRTSSETDDLPF